MRLSVVLSLIALAGCPAGAPAKAVQPNVPKVGGVDPAAKPPGIEACKGGERHDLMVLDWTPELRGDLEVAMKEGVAAIRDSSGGTGSPARRIRSAAWPNHR